MQAIRTFPLHVPGNKWLKRAGIFGFWFFLVKGLLWLAAPFVFYFLI